MTEDPGAILDAFIDQCWATGKLPYELTQAQLHVGSEVTAGEARNFLAAFAKRGDEPPLFRVVDGCKRQSNRYPPRADGLPRNLWLFEIGNKVRIETIVEVAATTRLRDSYGWPREHLIFESPTIVVNGSDALRYEALDMILLDEPLPELAAKMSLSEVRCRVAVEAKADAKLLGKRIEEIRVCIAAGGALQHQGHPNCVAIQVLKPRFFLGIATDTWRLFNIVEHDGRAVLGDELTPDLRALHFPHRLGSEQRLAV